MIWTLTGVLYFAIVCLVISALALASRYDDEIDKEIGE